MRKQSNPRKSLGGVSNNVNSSSKTTTKTKKIKKNSSHRALHTTKHRSNLVKSTSSHGFISISPNNDDNITQLYHNGPISTTSSMFFSTSTILPTTTTTSSTNSNTRSTSQSLLKSQSSLHNSIFGNGYNANPFPSGLNSVSKGSQNSLENAFNNRQNNSKFFSNRKFTVAAAAAAAAAAVQQQQDSISNNFTPNLSQSYPIGYEHPYGDWNRNRMLPLSTKNYEELKNFKVPIPYKYNMGVDMCDKHVYSGNGNGRAFLYVNQETGKDYTVNYKFISEESNKVAHALRHMGIKKGDRIALLMSQSIEVAIMHAAVYKIGGIAVPLSVLFGPEALEYRIKASGAKTLFIEPSKTDEVLPILEKCTEITNIVLSPHLSSLSEHDSLITTEQITKGNDLKGLSSFLNKKFYTFSEILNNASKQHVIESTQTISDDPALIIFTSGTTGNPKAALHRQSVLLGHLPGTEFFYDLWPQKNDLIFTGSDVSWIGGLLNTLLTSMHHGVPVLLNRAKKFDADYMFHLLEKYDVKNAFLPPTALKMMREVPNPRSKYNYNVRSIGSGGESLGESMLNWGRETFNTTICEFYGQTECNLVLGNAHKLKPVKNGSMGVPIPGHVVEVIDDAGKVVPTGHVGQIAVKSPHPLMFSGYFNNPTATEEKYITDPQTSIKWLTTGDLGKKDDEGYFYYIGRNDDVINSAGYRIGPAEVEMSLMGHNAVSNACVVGVPDDLRNEVVKAFVVLTPQAQSHYFGGRDEFQNFIKTHPNGNYDHINGNNNDNNSSENGKKLQHDLQNFVKTKLAKHEFPRQVEFVSELPMTTTGKVIRKVLKKQEFERYYKALGKPVPEGMF